MAEKLNLEGFTERTSVSRRKDKKVKYFVNEIEEIIAKQCLECKEVKLIELYSISKRGLGSRESKCKKCASKLSRKYRAKKQGKTEEDFQKWCYTYKEVAVIFEVHGCSLLESEYINSKTPMRYVCNCGNYSKITLSDLQSGRRCKKCGNEKRSLAHRFTYKEVVEIFKENGCTLLETEYINANTPMKYICVCGEPSRIRLGDFRSGKRCKKCAIERISGENHPNYNPELTEEERIINRKYAEYFTWRTEVFERDNYTCQCCGNVGVKLAAHHLDGYHWCIEKRTDIDNGITLCNECHKNFHHVCGNRNNTKHQFEQWLLTKKKQIS